MKFPSIILMAALLAMMQGASAQNKDRTSNEASGHPNQGTTTSGLGSPSAGADGSTGASHTPGTSASGAAVRCPELTMRSATSGRTNSGPSVGSARNSGDSGDIACANQRAGSTGGSGASNGGSGTSGGAASGGNR